MKIAVSTTGATLDSPMDPRFGRAAGLIVYSIEDDTFVFLDNTDNMNAAQGAGIKAAQRAVDSGASVVISGQLGPKAYSALHNAGVESYVHASGTVREAIAAYRNGRLELADRATTPGHWK